MAQPPALGNSVTGGFTIALPQLAAHSLFWSRDNSPAVGKARANAPPSPAVCISRSGTTSPSDGCAPGKRPQALPISKPAAKTRAPPRTTWKIALLHGVSIQWFWIQAMAQSSTKTTAMATEVAMVKSGIR